ncbi:MAG: hypothetical protein Q9216_002478 [Gyalolechia sp. 2 TL-2023]
MATTQSITVVDPLRPVAIGSIVVHEQGEKLQHASELARPYRQRDTSKALKAISSNYIVIAVCVALSKSALGSLILSAWITWLLYLSAVLVIASRLRAFENLVHEASHNNLFPSATLHLRLQFLYAFPVFRIVEDYRRSHLIHHKHLGDANKDPDIIRFFSLGLDRLPERPLWYFFGLPMTGFLTYEYLTTTFWEFWESASQRSAKIIFWASLGLGLAYTGACWDFVHYYLVPFLVILPVTRYWAELSEHLGLDMRGEYGGSRTNIGLLHQWYFNPHNDGYHAVHHLCSQVPFYLLPQAHSALEKGSEDFANRSAISNGVMETLRQMMAKKTFVKDETDGGRISE